MATINALIRLMGATRESRKETMSLLANRFTSARPTKGDDMPSVINEAKLFMAQNYSNPNLMLPDVAAAINMSKSRFSTVFSQYTGQTFTEYLIHLRLSKAKELLKTTNYKNSQIADETGYNDSHYFSYIFKKNTGMTPSEYRAQYQNQPE